MYHWITCICSEYNGAGTVAAVDTTSVIYTFDKLHHTIVPTILGQALHTQQTPHANKTTMATGYVSSFIKMVFTIGK